MEDQQHYRHHYICPTCHQWTSVDSIQPTRGRNPLCTGRGLRSCGAETRYVDTRKDDERSVQTRRTDQPSLF